MEGAATLPTKEGRRDAATDFDINELYNRVQVHADKICAIRLDMSATARRTASNMSELQKRLELIESALVNHIRVDAREIEDVTRERNARDGKVAGADSPVRVILADGQQLIRVVDEHGRESYRVVRDGDAEKQADE